MVAQTEAEEMLSVASAVRQAVMHSSGRIWTYADFAGLKIGAVSQALSRLSRQGLVRRVRKGVYYRPKQTGDGDGECLSALVNTRFTARGARPTGPTAAQILGLTGQNPIALSSADLENGVLINLLGVKTKVRRPALSEGIGVQEAAILEFLRDRGETSDLAPTDIAERLVRMLSDRAMFDRVAKAALKEPPRVRAMLGALGQQAGVPTIGLQSLRRSLNPLSRYNFGHLRSLKHAQEWQAR